MTIKEINQIQEGVSEYIQDLLKKIPEEHRANLAQFICFQVTVYGSNNMFQGIGVLEYAKKHYTELCEKILMGSDEKQF